MRQKIKTLQKEIVERISPWDCVEAITLAEQLEAEENDPYFFLSFDVFINGELPSQEERFRVLENAGGFESSSVALKDRFLIQDIPIRLEYKKIARIDAIIDSFKEDEPNLRFAGTYLFYRLKNSSVLYSRSQWISSIRELLEEVPDKIWNTLRETCVAKMEHSLADLRSAAVKQDQFFWLISLSGYLMNLTRLLFCINRQFEPSGRQMYNEIYALPKLPDNFRGRFESLIKNSPEFSRGRKAEIAQLLTRSITPIQ